jgi:hypothetical protein
VTGVDMSGKSLMSELTQSFAFPAGQSLFKPFKQPTENVSPGKADSLKIGSHQSTTKAIRFFRGNAYAVTLTA